MTSTNDPWILGLSASHNGAACLLHGDEIVVAIQEERLIGLKRAQLRGARPSLAVNYCLQYAGIAASDLDLVVLSAQMNAGAADNDLAANPVLDVKGNGIPTAVISHHGGHAISAYATSGFDDAAVLVIDGMGSPAEDLSDDERAAVIDPVENGFETTSLYAARGPELHALEKHMVKGGRWLAPPRDGSTMKSFGSLGGMFSAVARQIFGNEMDAGKVMGLAPYGTPTIASGEFFEIVGNRFVFHDHVPRRFSQSDRWPKFKRKYQDLAASTQIALEDAILHLVRRLRELSPSENLVYAGGVALNSVANERIIREGGFRRVYVMPAAEDSGVAVGAAYHGLWTLTGTYTPRRLVADGFGCVYGADEIASAVARTPALRAVPTDDVVAEAADLIVDGATIGWFCGRSELGPRALGQRSILCDPRRPDAKEQLNSRVKHREAFRPFAPVIPLEEVGNWFDVEGVDPESPFMLRVMAFREDRMAQVPGVAHVDGTGRVQTVTREVNGRYYDLVQRFHEKTGVPILLNTSFNVMGEPIVETPDDALWCLLMTGLDYCVLDDTIVGKKAAYDTITSLYPFFLIDGSHVTRSDAGEPAITFLVETPWGEQPFRIADRAKVAVLERLLDGLVDGNTSGVDLFRKVRAAVGSLQESFLIRLLAQLRRLRVISFRESPVESLAT